ncbi:hypothetical protein [Roseimaritima ulvae]|uniref:50S ribosomal protein L7/L12 n=1 Tax=Roseimaritima ulvae TaxID=980254 RepID=A0A5B9R7X4_9BACT|nr:hypothetical protein [Roseimaritima ulvae]QEG42603.1 hypothetical protein UC8_46450 [Roseimaritima ulvae]
MDETDRRRIEALLISGKKLAAVKQYREATGASLAESKRAVEALQPTVAPAQPTPSTPSTPITDSNLNSQIVSLLHKGERIEAVKLYKSHAGVRLKEAKQAVDRIGEQHGIPITSGSGCLGLILVVIVGIEMLTAAFV